MLAGLTLELWSHPPGPLHGLRRIVVAGSHWVHDHGLTSGGIGVAIGVAGLGLTALLWWVDRRQRPSLQEQERKVMLQRVRYRWIDCVLDRSLARAVWLQLGLTYRPDALQRDLAIRRPGHSAEMVPPGTTIGELFDSLGGGLLILGSPGAGKTTLLLELTRDLLDRAATQPAMPIPAVFNLSSWALDRRSLDDWLCAELAARYDVPRRTARVWVRDNRLLPLLDGLDEVAPQHRDECVEAVNAFRQEHGLLPFAVCSRTEDYQRLTRRLRLDEAVELQPPTDAQMNDYLTEMGMSTEGLRSAMRADKALMKLLRSPLLLSVAALAFHDRPARELVASSVGQHRKVLLDAYIRRMVEHRPSRNPGEERQMLQRLRWLAHSMRNHSQTDFYLDRLQPDWLPSQWQQRLVILIPAAVVGFSIGMTYGFSNKLAIGARLGALAEIGPGVAAGLAFGLASSGFASEPVMRLRSTRLWASIAFGVLIGLAAGRCFGWDSGLAAGSAAGVVAGLVLGLSSRIASGCAAGLGMGVAFGVGGGLVDGLAGGLAAGLAVGLTAALIRSRSVIEPVEQLRFGRPWVAVASALAAGILAGLAFGPISGAAVALAIGFVAGLTGGLTAERGSPNEGIRRSARHMVIAGLIAWLTVGVANNVVWGPEVGLTAGLAAGLAAGFIFGGGAALRHLVLRGLLVYDGIAPWRYVRFLDAATDRLFLRRNGSGYLFVHRLLRDHFASSRFSKSLATEAS